MNRSHATFALYAASRAAGLTLALVVTLATLMGIDALSQPDAAAAPQWAHQASATSHG